MSIKFITTSKRIIYLQKFSTVLILLSNNQSIKLLNIIFILECESNLISFGQLQDIDFTYYNELIKITLMRRGKSLYI